MTPWRLLVHGAGSPAWNMAVDEALLREVTAPVLRLYEWDVPAVSLGVDSFGQSGSVADLYRAYDLDSGSPDLGSGVLIANNGGFTASGGVESLTLTASVPWTLDAPSPARWWWPSSSTPPIWITVGRRWVKI